jgi:hypothetical protein
MWTISCSRKWNPIKLICPEMIRFHRKPYFTNSLFYTLYDPTALPSYCLNFDVCIPLCHLQYLSREIHNCYVGCTH